jgi:predicted glycogen debranching enzyme
VGRGPIVTLPCSRGSVTSYYCLVSGEIEFDRQICGNVAEVTSREWLETNGIGGFASSTIIGLNTRRYHGLLVAATKPPVGRMVLLSKLEETLALDGERFELSANQYAGTIHPNGYVYLESFRAKPFPQFIYRVGGVLIEKSVLLVRGQNSVAVRYQISGDFGGRKCSIEIRPLIAFRDYHNTTHANDSLNRQVEERPGVASIKPYGDLPSLHFAHNADGLDASGFWFYNFHYERERERGLDFQEDLYSPFGLHFDLAKTACPSILASIEEHKIADTGALRTREMDRRKRIEAAAPAEDEFARLLTSAADQFIVARGEQKSVIAGYH